MNARPGHLHLVRDDEHAPVESEPGPRIIHVTTQQARPSATWVLGSILGYAVGSAIVALLFG